MAPFRFRLQPVLEQRLREERRHQSLVAQVEAERLGLEGELRRRNELLEGERGDWRGRIGADGGVDLRGARMQATASLAHRAEAQRLVLRLAGVHARLERARAGLLEATTRRRAVELLREKHREAWLADLRRRENQAQDDLTVTRYGRPGYGASEVA